MVVKPTNITENESSSHLQESQEGRDQTPQAKYENRTHALRAPEVYRRRVLCAFVVRETQGRFVLYHQYQLVLGT